MQAICNAATLCRPAKPRRLVGSTVQAHLSSYNKISMISAEGCQRIISVQSLKRENLKQIFWKFAKQKENVIVHSHRVAETDQLC